jgi:hypothetical protein
MGFRRFSLPADTKHPEPLAYLWELGFGHDHFGERKPDIKTLSGSACRKPGRDIYQVGEIGALDNADPACSPGKVMPDGCGAGMSNDQ